MRSVLIIILLVSISIVSNSYAELPDSVRLNLNYYLDQNTKKCMPFPEEFKDELIKSCNISETNKQYIKYGWYVIDCQESRMLVFKTLDLCEKVGKKL